MGMGMGKGKGRVWQSKARSLAYVLVQSLKMKIEIISKQF